MNPQRYSMRTDAASRGLLRMVLLKPEDAFVLIDETQIEVRMGWAFHASFPRSAVVKVQAAPRRPLSRGVHGWNGRWLVNGSGDGIRILELAPTQRARVCGFPVRLRELWVSLEDPAGLQAALERRG